MDLLKWPDMKVDFAAVDWGLLSRGFSKNRRPVEAAGTLYF